MAITLSNGTLFERSPVTRPPLNRKFLTAIIALYLVAAHIFAPQLIPASSGLSLMFNNAILGVFSFALGIGLYQIARNGYIRYNKLTLGLFISCLLLIAPIFYFESNLYSLIPRVSGLFLGLLLFVVLQQFHFSNKQKQRLLWVILLSSLIEAVIGYGQYMFTVTSSDSIGVRPEGAFQHPNTMATMLATGFIISGYLLARLSHKYNRQAINAITLYVTPVILIPLIVIIASRTGWLSAAIGGGMLIPYLYRHSTRKRFRGWVFSTLCGLALGLLMGLSNTGSQNLITTKAQFNDFRTTLYPQALDMLIEKPITGYGLGEFESEYILYTAKQHHLNPQYAAAIEGIDHPHNEILLWGIEGGILSIVGIILAASLILMRIYSAKEQTRLATLALMLPILLHAMLEKPFYHSMLHWITLVILLYWIDQRTPRSTKTNITKVTAHLVRSTAFVLPIVVSLFIAGHLNQQYRIHQYNQQQIDASELMNTQLPLIIRSDDYILAFNDAKLTVALSKQDPQLVTDYINWAVETIAHQPKAELYQGLLDAYQSRNGLSELKQLEREANYLFPNHKFSVQVSQQPVDTAHP